MARSPVLPLRSLAAWLVGASVLALPARAQTPSDVGQWSSVMTWPISATHTSLQPDGRVMFIGEFDEGTLPPRRWDPLTNAVTSLPVPGYNIFCAGHSYLADGKLLFTGGHVVSDVGLKDASLFDPFTSSWIRLPDMNAGRWYPSNTTLANGDVLVLSGEMNGSGDINTLPQRFLAATRTWKDMTTARLSLPLYPKMFLAPSGRLFFAGPSRGSRWLSTAGTGTWSTGPSSNYGTRSYGPAVYLDAKVYIIGGGDPPTATAEVIDLNQDAPAWRYVASMSIRRRQHNATLLPDGTVLVTGGSSGSGFDNASAPVFQAELYDPAKNTWRRLASNAVYRGYHSTAVLLPDGRVLSAGGRNNHTAEVFSPPYLFKGARPTLTAAPDTVMPGTTFTVTTPDAARITKVTLIAPGSVTHTFDMNQRLVTLSFTRGSGSLTVTAPSFNSRAPPGYHQLFLVNDAGVPSVGKMVRVLRRPTVAAGALQDEGEQQARAPRQGGVTRMASPPIRSCAACGRTLAAREVYYRFQLVLQGEQDVLDAPGGGGPEEDLEALVRQLEAGAEDARELEEQVHWERAGVVCARCRSVVVRMLAPVPAEAGPH